MTRADLEPHAELVKVRKLLLVIEDGRKHREVKSMQLLVAREPDCKLVTFTGNQSLDLLAERGICLLVLLARSYELSSIVAGHGDGSHAALLSNRSTIASTLDRNSRTSASSALM